MMLALFGVSNGAIQFMTYEELKRWRIDKRIAEGAGEDGKNLVCLDLLFFVVVPAICSWVELTFSGR